MRFVVATFAALILVLSTAIIGSGHIALADNHKFTRDFSDSGNNKDVTKPSKDFLTPYYKGMAYLNAGNYTEAISYFDKALAINPNYSLALNNKGAAIHGLGIYNESIAYYDKVLAIEPTNALALAGKKLDLAAFSKTNFTLPKPTSTIATAQNPQSSEFGYFRGLLPNFL